MTRIRILKVLWPFNKSNRLTYKFENMKKTLMIALFLVSAVAFGQKRSTLKDNGISMKGNTLTMNEVPPTSQGTPQSVPPKAAPQVHFET